MKTFFDYTVSLQKSRTVRDTRQVPRRWRRGGQLAALPSPDLRLLLGVDHQTFGIQCRRRAGGAQKAQALNRRIGDFTAWANREAERHGIPDQVIPADPGGAVGVSRFRRPLAWHAARRPDSSP